MSDDNKRNLPYFEAPTMRELFDVMPAWQNEQQKRLLSLNIQREGSTISCIALTNPTEVVITNSDGKRHADVSQQSSDGKYKLFVYA